MLWAIPPMSFALLVQNPTWEFMQHLVVVLFRVLSLEQLLFIFCFSCPCQFSALSLTVWVALPCPHDQTHVWHCQCLSQCVTAGGAWVPHLDMLTLIPWSRQRPLGFSTSNSPFFPWSLIILWEAFWGYTHILFFIKPPLIAPTFICHHYDCQVTVSHFPFFLISWHSTVKKSFLFSPICLFLCLSVGTRGFLFQLGNNLSQPCLCWCPNCPSFVHWEPPCGSCVFFFLSFLMSPLHSLNISISGTKCSSLILCFLAPPPESSLFKAPKFLAVECGV